MQIMWISWNYPVLEKKKKTRKVTEKQRLNIIPDCSLIWVDKLVILWLNIDWSDYNYQNT